jgi:aryl-alcohol dehydrogenase-like predicted oxidoreductase
MAALTRTLGRSGPAVSAIGLGAWAIGGPHSRDGKPIGWGEVDDDESVRAIHAALGAGITYIDTADVYGCGHSERVIARALRGRRDGVVVSTKFGFTYDEQTKESPGSDASPAYIRRACEASLTRLETDVIDLYQFHLNQYPLDRAGEVRDTLDALVAEGKIRAFGWSTDDAERAAFFAESPNCASVQQRFNLFDGDVATLEVAERTGLASIVRSPLGMGLLTGKMSKQTSFSETDVRSEWDFGGRQGEQLDRLADIRSILTGDGRTLAQGALGWLLARSEALVPIPGIRTVAQAEENAGVLARGPLPQSALAEIDGILAAQS